MSTQRERVGRRSLDLQTVAPGVHFAEGPESNWTVLTGDGTTTLIDCGYPVDYKLVVRSIELAGGRPDDLRTILVTHGHADHIGTAARLVRDYGALVLVHPAERANVAREELHQVGLPDVLRRAHRPRVLRWALRAVSAGGLQPVAVDHPVSFDPAASLEASGHAVEVVETIGHTPGHCAYWIRDARVLVLGDALVSAHPTSPASGLQLLDEMFHSDPRAARAALGALAEFEPVHVLPGHGPAIDGARWAETLASVRSRPADRPRP